MFNEHQLATPRMLPRGRCRCVRADIEVGCGSGFPLGWGCAWYSWVGCCARVYIYGFCQAVRAVVDDHPLRQLRRSRVAAGRRRRQFNLPLPPRWASTSSAAHEVVQRNFSALPRYGL